jgi:hypothetical protein
MLGTIGQDALGRAGRRGSGPPVDPPRGLDSRNVATLNRDLHRRVADGRLPADFLIVRELLDERGDIAKLTPLERGPDGSKVGDLWLAAMTPGGVPLVEAASGRRARSRRAGGCHMLRRSSGFIYGLEEP